MGKYYLKNGIIVNEGKSFKGNIFINENRIALISPENITVPPDTTIVDVKNKWILPGVIDDQVHFREPGLTHKADIFTESRAAAAGGVTSYMEMPNTNPQTVNSTELEKKFEIAAEKSLVNYSFYFGATNNNLEEIRNIDPKNVCGLKVFMGSSTGNMLVDNQKSLESIFAESPVIIATHCEDEITINNNSEYFRKKFGNNVPVNIHHEIRSVEACYRSSSLAVSLAEKYNARLHVLHISTEKELELFRNDIPLSAKKITAEVCVHHLWFNSNHYDEKGSFIKWNPAIKTENDRLSLLRGLKENRLDVVATDHAPHTFKEKSNTSYFAIPSGGPMVQHSLTALLQFVKNGEMTVEFVVEKMCHNPAILFNVHNRGFLRKGYYADIVVVNPAREWKVEKSGLFYKCGWSPLEDTMFGSKVEKTFVNGEIVFDDGKITEKNPAMRLSFDR